MMKRNLYTPNCVTWKYVRPRPIEMQEKLIIHSPWGPCGGGLNPKVNRKHKDKAGKTVTPN